jgi:hypothetical protein
VSARAKRRLCEVLKSQGMQMNLWGGKSSRGRRSAMLNACTHSLWLLLTAILAWARPRHDLVLENLLLRHQLAELTRPTRTRPCARLRTRDKLLWVLVRR